MQIFKNFSEISKYFSYFLHNFPVFSSVTFAYFGLRGLNQGVEKPDSHSGKSVGSAKFSTHAASLNDI